MDHIVCPQGSYFEAVTPSVTVFGDRTYKVIKVK